MSAKYLVAYPHPSLPPDLRIKTLEFSLDTYGELILERLKDIYPDHSDGLEIAADATLYQSSGISCEAVCENSLQEVCQWLDNREEHPEIQPWSFLEELFPNGPNHPLGDVDIMVVTKEILEYGDRVQGRLGRERVAEAALERGDPSEDAKCSSRLITQNSENLGAIRDERPVHISAPPIQIYHPVFTKFLSRAYSEFDGDEETLRLTSQFIGASREYYANVRGRVFELQPSLQALVHPTILEKEMLFVGATSHVEPDGIVRVIPDEISMRPQFPICAFTEVENEVGTGGCDPALRCQSDFVKVYSSDNWREYRDKSCCPAFLLAIAGPRLMISGAIFADTLVVQELTDYINIGSHPTDPDRGLRRIAQVLVALKECIGELTDFYKKLMTVPSPFPPPQSMFPYHTQCTIGNRDTRFTYTKRLTPKTSARAVFAASIDAPLDMKGKIIIVKFTRRYCPEAHRLLAEHSLAPKLLYHAMIEGARVHFVVMERLVATTTPRLNRSGENSKRQVESLRKAVRTLHEGGFVFGDLRLPNVLITKDGLKLVDFDWCGKEGEARYPVHLSKEIDWPEGVVGEEKMMQAHDRAWFKVLTGGDL